MSAAPSLCCPSAQRCCTKWCCALVEATTSPQAVHCVGESRLPELSGACVCVCACALATSSYLYRLFKPSNRSSSPSKKCQHFWDNVTIMKPRPPPCRLAPTWIWRLVHSLDSGRSVITSSSRKQSTSVCHCKSTTLIVM